MDRAVAARLADLHLRLFDALRLVGFDYPQHNDSATAVDSEMVSLGQHENRLRMVRKKTGEEETLATPSSPLALSQDATSSQPPNSFSLKNSTKMWSIVVHHQTQIEIHL